MFYPLLLTAVFGLTMFYLTSNSFTAMRLAPAFPFVTIVFGLLFLYLFIGSADDIGKYWSGIMFLICGFACMKDVESLRRKGKTKKQPVADK